MKVIIILKRTLLVLIFTTSFSIAYSQTTKQITISVQGVEYEDPRFTALREMLKKNPKVRSVKPAFSEGIATLTLNYTGDASELWDEVPKSSKQSLKLEAIDDDTISLTSITGKNKTTVSNTASKSNNQPVKNVTTKPKNPDKKDCGDCEYFPICDYDGTKSFQGKIFRKLEYDEGIVYYNCDNGVVAKKWEIILTSDQGDEISKGFTTMIILKSNVPVGTKWSTEIDKYFNPFSSMKYTYTWEITAKDININLNGTDYKNVIVVEEKIGSAYFTGTSNFINYYAKGVGFIKRISEAEANSEKLTANSWKNTILIPKGEFKGQEAINIFSFNADGTIQEYSNYNYLNVTDGAYLLYPKLFHHEKGKEICKWEMQDKLIKKNCGGRWYDFGTIENKLGSGELYLKYFRPGFLIQDTVEYYRMNEKLEVFFERYEKKH